MQKRFLIMAGALGACWVISEIVHDGRIAFAGPFVGVTLVLLFGFDWKRRK